MILQRLSTQLSLNGTNEPGHTNLAPPTNIIWVNSRVLPAVSAHLGVQPSPANDFEIETWLRPCRPKSQPADCHNYCPVLRSHHSLISSPGADEYPFPVFFFLDHNYFSTCHYNISNHTHAER